jgi:hypothetical protein
MSAPRDPCEACDFAVYCEDGYLCPMVRPDLEELDEDCEEARELAEYMAVAK